MRLFLVRKVALGEPGQTLTLDFLRTLRVLSAGRTPLCNQRENILAHIGRLWGTPVRIPSGQVSYPRGEGDPSIMKIDKLIVGLED